jgi:hypothetical protein
LNAGRGRPEREGLSETVTSERTRERRVGQRRGSGRNQAAAGIELAFYLSFTAQSMFGLGRDALTLIEYPDLRQHEQSHHSLVGSSKK